jgi:epidermal growth factor receptor substrate 15
LSSGLPDVSEPPAPPQSGQITSAALPFRAPLSRGDSISSSTKVAPPASRISPAGTPGTATPEASTASTYSQPEIREPAGIKEAKELGAPAETSPFEQTTPAAAENKHDSFNSSFGPATNQRLADIPGAFPSAETPRSITPQPDLHPTAIAGGAGVATLAAGAGVAAAVTHEHDKHQQTEEEPQGAAESDSNNRNSNFDDFFGGPARSRSDSEKAAEFDSAFSTMKKSPVTNGDANTSNKEFPPIWEVEAGEESDDSSEAPMAFDDNFNTTSPPRPPKIAEAEASRNAEQVPIASAVPGYLQSTRPPLETTSSTGSSLPGIEAQTSPPGYNESVPHDDPSHFPPEFKGLLSRREDPTSPTPIAGSTFSPAATASHAPSGYGPEHDNEQILREQGPSAAAQRQFTSDDFDSAFAGMNMSAAPVEDDDDEDDDTFSSSRNAAIAFDPTFDSPRQSKSTSAAIPPSTSVYSSVTNGQPSQNNSSHAGTAPGNLSGFDSAPHTVNTTSVPPSAAPAANPSHDWDAIFAGLDTPAPAAADDFAPAPPTATSPTSMTTKATAALASRSPPPPASLSPQPARPALGRALTAGTEHDDPILKRLTSMGWSREESLAALEKYDYNIDKVRKVRESARSNFASLTHNVIGCRLLDV